MTSQFAEIPIDADARNGAFHCLRADDGTLHCGQWNGETFVYSSAVAIPRLIVAYHARVPGGRADTLQ